MRVFLHGKSTFQETFGYSACKCSYCIDSYWDVSSCSTDHADQDKGDKEMLYIQAENIHNNQFMGQLCSPCLSVLRLLWQNSATNPVVLPAQSWHSSMVDVSAKRSCNNLSSIMCMFWREQNAAGHAMGHINSLGRTGAGEGTVLDGIWQALFSQIPIPQGLLSYPVLLVSPVTNSFFFLGSCMRCHNEDRVFSRSGTWRFLSRGL